MLLLLPEPTRYTCFIHLIPEGAVAPTTLGSGKPTPRLQCSPHHLTPLHLSASLQGISTHSSASPQRNTVQAIPLRRTPRQHTSRLQSNPQQRHLISRLQHASMQYRPRQFSASPRFTPPQSSASSHVSSGQFRSRLHHTAAQLSASLQCTPKHFSASDQCNAPQRTSTRLDLF